jgi:hypothetical protein
VARASLPLWELHELLQVRKELTYADVPVYRYGVPTVLYLSVNIAFYCKLKYHMCKVKTSVRYIYIILYR